MHQTRWFPSAATGSVIPNLIERLEPNANENQTPGPRWQGSHDSEEPSQIQSTPPIWIANLVTHEGQRYAPRALA